MEQNEKNFMLPRVLPKKVLFLANVICKDTYFFLEKKVGRFIPLTSPEFSWIPTDIKLF